MVLHREMVVAAAADVVTCCSNGWMYSLPVLLVVGVNVAGMYRYHTDL